MMASVLRVEEWTMPSAGLGPENPLPPISAIRDRYAYLRPDVSVPGEDREHLGWGSPPGILPYRMLDGYTRTLEPRPFKVVVLENEILKAAFFVGVGGRLWSLVHKPTGRELLARNEVFQPCNLALRNAWISGGVEWNTGWTGHWPHTVSPLFAAEVQLPDGTPALRMWEWERVREMAFQIDAWLPEGSPVLLVRVALHNPHPHAVPVYWWSNIAVEQHRDVRVLVPADSALTNNYSGRLAVASVPVNQGHDTSYAMAMPHACDFFYRIPADERPWIAAVNAGGRGLFQTSTSLLRGRKLFRWGTQNGGRLWQRFLGTPDYIEIQAGLARTQMHHLPLPPGATWAWIEAYGEVQVDGAAVQGADWRHATQTVATAIEALVPEARLEALLASSAAWADRPPQALLSRGSGWGALERKRREQAGEPGLGLPGLVFPEDSIGADQAPWCCLLEQGRFPESDPLCPPVSYMVQREWIEMMERSLATPGGRHWSAWFHYGVMQWYRDHRVGAALAWMEAGTQCDNPWSERCLGMVALFERRPADAVKHLAKARERCPDLFPLLVELLAALLDNGQAREALDLIASTPPGTRQQGRVSVFEARARLQLGLLDEAEQVLLTMPIPADLKEGESSLTDLWYQLQEAREVRRRGGPLEPADRTALRRACQVPARIDYCRTMD